MKPLFSPARVSLGVGLNDNEVQVLRHLASGQSVAQTASAMAVTTNTMRTPIRRIRAKLALTGRDSAVERARDLGVL